MNNTAKKYGSSKVRDENSQVKSQEEIHERI